VQTQLEKELALIDYKKYESFFLTVYDIVKWARERDPPILCQGRGSSANSAVCYCLGITVVDPEKGTLLFERFLSHERNEPPDIDVDFEHERREEVIQHVFEKYGRGRAALAATVISYRSKSAVRDVGTRTRPARRPARSSDRHVFARAQRTIARRVADRSAASIRPAAFCTSSMRSQHKSMAFPRHLSQHVGGFVISEQPLHHLVPVENAAMPDRTIIQWDKDDLEEMNSQGRLPRARHADLAAQVFRSSASARPVESALPYRGRKPSLETCSAARRSEGYEMICAADTVGVFQIESRAQMSMLPRLAPNTVTTISSSRSRSCGRVRSRATWFIRTCAAAKAKESDRLSAIEGRARLGHEDSPSKSS
jgi:error-prone DNA polymerase